MCCIQGGSENARTDLGMLVGCAYIDTKLQDILNGNLFPLDMYSLLYIISEHSTGMVVYKLLCVCILMLFTLVK